LLLADGGCGWVVVVMVIAMRVPPVIPKILPFQSGNSPVVRERRPLPVPALDSGSPTVPDTVYALSAVDKSGRVADRSIVRALGWAPRTRLDIREHSGIVVARPAADGVHRVDDRGHLRLPLAVRRWCRLGAGDRVLCTADAARGVLVAYPLPVLGRLLTGQPAAAVEGEAR
jgi:bifunctional DNA-binding transcriptional regulator/antitoxin component of YhaV-PrlF toxin-antitoxin module